MPERCPVCGAVKPMGSPNIERDAMIRRLYKDGTLIEELTKHYHLGTQRIRQIIGKDNIKEADKFQWEKYWAKMIERNRQIADLYFNERYSYTELATKYELSRERIREIIKKELKRRRRPHP